MTDSTSRALELARECGFDQIGTGLEASGRLWDCWEPQLLEFYAAAHAEGVAVLQAIRAAEVAGYLETIGRQSEQLDKYEREKMQRNQVMDEALHEIAAYAKAHGLTEVERVACAALDEALADKPIPEFIRQRPDGFSLPWDRAPAWASFWAQDEDGWGYWYERRPVAGDVEWALPYGGDGLVTGQKGAWPGDWKDSLQRRPA